MTRLLLLLCFAFVAIPRGAHAEDAATKTAKKHFDHGQKLFALGRFDEALEEITRRPTTPSRCPISCSTSASAIVNLGDFDRAIFSYKKYLEGGDRTPTRTIARATGPIHVSPEAKNAKKPPKRAPDPRPGPVETEQHPIYKKWWFVTGLAIVAVGAGIGIYELTRPTGAGDRPRHRAGAVMRALVVLGLLLSACSDNFIVVTVDTRPAVHGASQLAITLASGGSTRTDTRTLGTHVFPVTFAVDSAGHAGDLTISIDALDDNMQLVGQGSIQTTLSAPSASITLDSADFVVNTDYAMDQELTTDYEAVGLQLAATADQSWTVTFHGPCDTTCDMLGRRFDVDGNPR